MGGIKIEVWESTSWFLKKNFTIMSLWIRIEKNIYMYYVQSITIKLAIIEKMQYTDNNLGTILGLKVRSIYKKMFSF